jgi:hypothetical protein
MQITLTPADIALEFAIGLLVIFVASILGSRLPRWFSNLLTWLANRSEESAAKRAASLRRELQTIEELKNDHSLYLATLALCGSKLVAGLGVTIISLVGGFGMVTLAIHSNSSGFIKNYHVTEILLTVFVCIGMVLLMITDYRMTQFYNYCKLGHYAENIQRQLAKLEARWPELKVGTQIGTELSGTGCQLAGSGGTTS